MSSRFAGKFIVLDGPDGCGKSTQAKMLSDWIKSQGCDVETYRDPGTTLIGEAIRDILLGVEYAGMADNVEVLLYMAARAQLLKDKILQSLDDGKCVVMDRWLSSTCAYQGKAGGFGIRKVIDLAKLSLERVWPDLTIILDLDLETSSSRITRELDRMEAKGDVYHNLVREGYIELYEIAKQSDEYKDKFALVDAASDIATVHSRVVDSVGKYF